MNLKRGLPQKEPFPDQYYAPVSNADVIEFPQPQQGYTQNSGYYVHSDAAQPQQGYAQNSGYYAHPDVTQPQFSSVPSTPFSAVPPQPASYPMAQSSASYNQASYNIPDTTQILNHPMASVAVAYGHNLADGGATLAKEKIQQYMMTSRIKHYFAVDTQYVLRKISLILFPFTHKNWALQFSDKEKPALPCFDINAPDMYIPVMALVTYLLVSGMCLGLQGRFTPELLGVQASTCLVWLVLEVFAALLARSLFGLLTDLRYLDVVCYAGYKYVGMICVLLGSVLFSSKGYFAIWLYCSISLAYFLTRSLRGKILPELGAQTVYSDGSLSYGKKRRLYLLLSIAFSQPFLMWWLSRNSSMS